MAVKKAKSGEESMFQSILDRAKNREQPELVEEAPVDLKPAAPQEDSQNLPVQPEPFSRKPGRPRGRRSDPNYTQITAYIPLELLFDVQDELQEEKRQERKRTARNVSELVESLLKAWLENQKSE